MHHPIMSRWPATRPDVIQLYSSPTPNGIKASLALEEMGLAYEPHLVTLDAADVKSDAFTALNPNGKIPAIWDPNGPDGAPIGVFESGAILIYLAEKTGKFFGDSAAERMQVMQWLMWQMGGVGPMFGQMGFFTVYGGKDMTDPLARDRYVGEARRLLGVLDGHLAHRDWVAGGYSIADMAIGPWIAAVPLGYQVSDLVGWDDFPRVNAYLERFGARPAVARARDIPKRAG